MSFRVLLKSSLLNTFGIELKGENMYDFSLSWDIQKACEDQADESACQNFPKN